MVPNLLPASPVRPQGTAGAWGGARPRSQRRGPGRGRPGVCAPSTELSLPKSHGKSPFVAFVFGGGRVVGSGWHGRQITSWCGGVVPRLRLGPYVSHRCPPRSAPSLVPSHFPASRSCQQAAGAYCPVRRETLLAEGGAESAQRRGSCARLPPAQRAGQEGCGGGGGEQGSVPHPRTPNVSPSLRQREARKKISPWAGDAGREAKSPAPGTGSRSFPSSGPQ